LVRRCRHGDRHRHRGRRPLAGDRGRLAGTISSVNPATQRKEHRLTYTVELVNSLLARLKALIFGKGPTPKT